MILTSISMTTEPSEYVRQCKSFLDATIVGHDLSSCDMVTHQLAIEQTPNSFFFFIYIR